MPQATKKLRLRRKAGDGHTGGDAGTRHGAEIDVRGHVAQSGVEERVGERAMAIMGH